MDVWLIQSLGVIICVLRESSISMPPIRGSFLVQVLWEVWHKEDIWYPCIQKSDLGGYLSYSRSYESFQIYVFYTRFLIIFLLLSMDKFTITRVQLSFRFGPYPIVNCFLSITAQLFCKIMIVSFWVNLNTRPNCVVVQNLYLPSLLQDTTTNYNSGCIVVFCNLPNPDIIVKFKESHRCIIS